MKKKNEEISTLGIIIFVLIPVAIVISLIFPKDNEFSIPSYNSGYRSVIQNKYESAGLSEVESARMTEKTFKLFEKK